MKKLFLFAALAAMTIVSCTKEVITDGEVLDGDGTYATFAFNLAGPSGKAAADFEPIAVTEGDVLDAVIGVGDLYILVFNNMGALEYFSAVSANPHTALVSAGSGKRIFVLANMGSATAKQTGAFSALPLNAQGGLVADAMGTPIVGATIADIQSAFLGSGYSYAEFMALAFSAGTPQAHNVAKTGARTFSVVPLSGRVGGSPTAFGLPMSNTNEVLYTFAPNITDDATGAGDTTVPASPSGTNAKNRFSVQLKYLGAKARLVVNPASFSQTTAEITAPLYSIKNLAKYTSLIQNIVAGNPRSIYYGHAWGGTYINDIDQASTVSLTPATAANAGFVYVPENNNSGSLPRGQSSFYALNVTYKPYNVVSAVVFNPLTQKADLTTSSYTAQGLSAYVYVTDVAVLGDMTTPFFATPLLLAQAYWMNDNGKNITDASYASSGGDAAALALIAGKYKAYANAQSWYRLDIGSGTGSSTQYGVLRGNAYTATVNNITGPGEPSEGALFDDPDAPVVARTYINVTINTAVWTPVTQSGELN